MLDMKRVQRLQSAIVEFLEFEQGHDVPPEQQQELHAIVGKIVDANPQPNDYHEAHGLSAYAWTEK